VDIGWVVIHDFEMRLWRFAPIEYSECLFEIIVTTLLESDMERTVSRI
jgi:hypothetical protein